MKVVDMNVMKRIVIISDNPFSEFQLGREYIVYRWLANYLVGREYAEFKDEFENDIEEWIKNR